MSAFERHRESWSEPPVDEVGYVPSKDMLALTEPELVRIMTRFEQERYGGWRNENNRWRDVLGLDTTTKKVVLDYGTGTGIEALQYARSKNTVIVADIVESNVRLAQKVLGIHGYAAVGHVLEEHRPRAPIGPDSIDVVHMAGVLHHIEDAEDVVCEVAGWLRPGGQLRVMVYSDVSWQNVTGTHPPENVRQHIAFRKYVRAMDAVGDYADWYDATRLSRRFGGWFKVVRCEYLDSTLGYIGAVLGVKK